MGAQQNHEQIAGVGLGLRIPHVQQVLSQTKIVDVANIPWFEVLVDNWLVEGGLNQNMLLAIRDRYPLVFHGVGLSLGGTAPLDKAYLMKVKALKELVGADWYSEHASFSNSTGRDAFIPDLLPLPYTEEAIVHLTGRIIQAQDLMGERMLIENVSSYVSCAYNQMSEAEFIGEVANRADCYLLLDINNAYVNSINFDQPIDRFFRDLPMERVKQIHLAGFEKQNDFLLDTHSKPVAKPVWQLFETVLKRFGPIPSMIEWDNELPSLSQLLDERGRANSLLDQLNLDQFAGIAQCS